MKPEMKGLVVHRAWCENEDCDFEASAKNCIGLASQHAERTGHNVVAETGYHYEWNKPGSET
jgi:hypothetical protein